MLSADVKHGPDAGRHVNIAATHAAPASIASEVRCKVKRATAALTDSHRF